jgi:tetratricopeptide (TPR) repeat protein
MRLRLLAVVLSFAAHASFAAPSLDASQIDSVLGELRRIEAAVLRGQVDAVRVEYQSLIRERPAEAMPRIYLAWCTLPSNESWNALKGLSPIFPENPWVSYGLARTYLAWKMRDEGTAELEKLLVQHKRFYPALVAKADFSRLSKNWVDAEANYKAALMMASDPVAKAGLGVTFKEMGRPADALGALKSGLTEFPEQPQALGALFELAQQASDGEASLLAARTLADVQPKSREARRALADLRFSRGEKAEAVKEYERLLRLGDPDAEPARRLATLYRELKDIEGEERALIIVSALDKASATANLRLADLKLQKGDLEATEGQLLEALEREPQLAEPGYRLGRLAADKRLLHESLARWRSAASKQGPDAVKARDEADALSARLKLPAQPLSGSLEAVYAKAMKSIDGFFAERRRSNRSLSGLMKLRIQIEPDGQVAGVDVLEDQVGDALLTAHVHAILSQASYAPKKRDTTLEFELGEKKKAKKGR